MSVDETTAKQLQDALTNRTSKGDLVNDGILLEKVSFA